MSIVIEGSRLLEKVSAAARQEKIKAMRDKHNGKRVSQMSKQEQDELLEAIAQKLGLADENGVVK